mgnify:CR=1 FL=1
MLLLLIRLFLFLFYLIIRERFLSLLFQSDPTLPQASLSGKPR